MSVPKLRFPEFRDEKGWEEAKLGQLGKLVSGLTYSPEDVRDKGLLVLRSSNVQNGQIALDDNVYVNPDVKGANLSKPNDILICVRNGSKTLIGKNALIPDGMPLCTHGAFMTVFRSPSAKFVFQLFQTPAYQKQVDGDLGATINSINGSQFIKYKFNIPILPIERQKIAACLTSLDDLISVEGSKLDSLKTHKQGLMQQLFPQDGESVPRVRFEGFEGDWEERELLELSSRIKTLVGSRKLTTLSITAGLGFVSQKEKFGRDISGSQYEKYIVLKRGDFSYNKGNSKSYAQGCIYQLKNYDQAAVPNVFISFSFKPELCCGDFYEQFFVKNGHAEQLKKYITSGARSDGLLNINVDDFFKILVPLPSLTEQQKVAACLSSIDDLIAAQAAYIDTLKQHKKGLMQQLFPVADEAVA